MKLNSQKSLFDRGSLIQLPYFYIVANRALSSLVHKTNKIEISPRKMDVSGQAEGNDGIYG